MCPPVVAVLGFALSAASQVAGFAAQEAQASAQDAVWKQNYVNSLASARDDQNRITLRQMQEADAAAQKEHLQHVEVAQKRAAVVTAAGAGGVSGISVDALVADIERQGDLNRLTIQRNFQATAQQLQAEKDATNNTAMSRINSVSKGNHPSLAGLAIGIAGAGVGAYGDYKKANP